MDDLVQTLEKLAVGADKVFADIKKAGWIPFIDGAAGRRTRLKVPGESCELDGKGHSKEASDLLRGTRESAERILAMPKQASLHRGF